jgi:hypothetical protein
MASTTTEQAPAWQREGLVLPDALGPRTWDQLIEESVQLREAATVSGFTQTASHRDGSFCTPSQYLSTQGGPVLTTVLRNMDLLGLVREASGRPRLIPVRCGYNYYRVGAFMGLHRDSVKATITFTFALTEGLPPMGWAPQLREASSDELAALVASQDSYPAGHPVREVPFRQLSAFDGYNIPHWRPPLTQAGQQGVIGTFCYFAL